MPNIDFHFFLTMVNETTLFEAVFLPNLIQFVMVDINHYILYHTLTRFRFSFVRIIISHVILYQSNQIHLF